MRTLKKAIPLIPFEPKSLAMQWEGVLIRLVESRGNQWGITALAKAELHAYGIKGPDMGRDEMRDAVNNTIAFLELVGMGPCERAETGEVKLDKSGQRIPLTGKALAPLRGSCVNSLLGEDAKRKAAKTKTKPPVLPDTDAETPFDGPVSGTVPRDKVDNSPVNVAPRGDGIAALAALGHNSKWQLPCSDVEQTANIARAQKLMQKSKDKDVLALAAFVLDWFEITAPVCAEDDTD